MTNAWESQGTIERDEIAACVTITIVNDDECVFAIGTLRMGVNLRWYTVGRPSCVSDADMALSL